MHRSLLPALILALASLPAVAQPVPRHSPFAFLTRYDYPQLSVSAVGDLNGDGVLDLVGFFPSGSTSTGIGVYFGNGDGTFRPGPQSPAANIGLPLALRDFNGDGKLDLLLTSTSPE